jgi:putative SOS response-associated peptidase YedK
MSDVAEALDAEYAAADEQLYRPRFNVAPTDQAWIVEYGPDRRVIRPATWNYQVRDGRPLINVRGEQLASGAGFRDAFDSRRCAVVTDGFYEWPGKGLAPFWFHRADGGLVLLGGLFQRPRGADRYPRFTVLSAPPNRLVAAVHDRMPVVVPLVELDDWLTGQPARAARMLGAAPEDALISTAVSRHVNSAKHDDPACIADAAPETPAQRSLFS